MSHSRVRFGRCTVTLFVASVLLSGCDGLFYVTHVVQGQLGVQGNLEDIDDVLASGRLTDEQQAKLELVVRARAFAVDTIGLDAGDSYTLYYDTGGDPLAFNLSAARADALEAVTWSFPFIGEVPYLAFFDEDYMREEKQKLVDQGYDVFSYELDAYSTLGLFDDPVRSTMLKRGDLSLCDTIIHELLHNTIYRANSTIFNESLANFVGRQGAIEFLEIEHEDDPTWAEDARAYYADIDVVNAFLAELYEELEDFYAQDITSEEKIAGREAVYQAARDRFVSEVQPTLNLPDTFAGYANLPSNNAWMLGHRRYNLDLDLFVEVYETVSHNWTQALAVYRRAADGDSNPYDYLRDWLIPED